MANVTPGTIRLIIAAQNREAEEALARTGAGIDGLADSAGRASESMSKSGRTTDDWIETADKAEQRAMGFRDTITGVQDGFKGLTDDSLPLQDRMLLVGTGVGDLASGFANFLIPAISSLVAMMSGPLMTALTFVAAHPIIFALIALVAVIALLVIHWDTLKEVAMKVIAAVGGFLVDKLGGPLTWVKDRVIDLIDWFKSLPEKIGAFFGGLVQIITWPYRTAFNLIADAWNNTVGRLSVTIPSWVPGIGGNTWSAPRLPKFHSGGIVPGNLGPDVLSILAPGERVLPAGAGGGALELRVAPGADSAVATMIMSLIRTGLLQLTPVPV